MYFKHNLSCAPLYSHVNLVEVLILYWSQTLYLYKGELTSHRILIMG